MRSPGRGSRGQIKSLRRAVRLKRVQLKDQRMLYVQHRGIFQNQVFEFLQMVDSTVEPSDREVGQDYLQKRHQRLRDAIAAFAHHESLTSKLEVELSSLEYLLEQEEEQFYDHTASPLSSQMSEGGSDNSGGVETSNDSGSNESTRSLSLNARLHKLSQQVEFLQERLEDLDYDHRMDVDRRKWSEEQGEAVQPSLSRFIKIYEDQRASIIEELTNAERELQELRKQREQDHILPSTSPAPARFGKRSKLKDGVLRRFPGTYNGVFGYGLPQNKIAMGSVPFEERINGWLKSLLSADLASPKLQQWRPTGSINREREANSRALPHTDDDSMQHGYAWSRASAVPKNPSKLSIWQGDKPAWRHSNPDLYLNRSPTLWYLPATERPKSVLL